MNDTVSKEAPPSRRSQLTCTFSFRIINTSDNHSGNTTFPENCCFSVEKCDFDDDRTFQNKLSASVSIKPKRSENSPPKQRRTSRGRRKLWLIYLNTCLEVRALEVHKIQSTTFNAPFRSLKTQHGESP
jgi:hypothetical protein